MSVSYVPSGFIRSVVVDREQPRRGWCVDGYSKRGGGDTRYRVRCSDGRIRRVRCLLFSNAGSLILTIGGKTHFLTTNDEWKLREAKG